MERLLEGMPKDEKVLISVPIHYVTQVLLSFVFPCKIGDFAGEIAVFVCLQKKFVYLLSYHLFFGDFLMYALKTTR